MSDLAYDDYWRRKQILTELPHFPLRRWWRTDDLCDIENVYFEAIQTAGRLLDVGAGDLRVRAKFVRAGFRGDYQTQDIGSEYSQTYQTLDEIQGAFDAVLCLDVIEHLTLDDGLALLKRLVELLMPGGILIVQTPNARCIRSPLGWDITHLHTYNLADLWALARVQGLEATGYRVWFAPARLGPIEWVRALLGRLVCSQLLGSDSADNIALIARRPPSSSPN